MGINMIALQALLNDPNNRILLANPDISMFDQVRNGISLDMFRAETNCGPGTQVLVNNYYHKIELKSDWSPKKADWKVPAHKRKRTKAVKPSPLIAMLTKKL